MQLEMTVVLMVMIRDVVSCYGVGVCLLILYVNLNYSKNCFCFFVCQEH